MLPLDLRIVFVYIQVSHTKDEYLIELHDYDLYKILMNVNEQQNAFLRIKKSKHSTFHIQSICSISLR